MGSTPKLQHSLVLFFLCFLSLTHSSSSLMSDVHDLLPLYNLPKGLLPSNIKSYSLSNTDSSFTIELSDHPCYVKFDNQLVYFDRIIKGKLEYGIVSQVSGIQAKKLFVWLSVTTIHVDEHNGMLEFYAGSVSQKLPAKDFETIPSCKANGIKELTSFLESSI